MTTVKAPRKSRAMGEKVDVTVCAPEGFYANSPQVVRTDREIVLTFGVTEVEKLLNLKVHHHFQPFPFPHWAVSKDGGFTWHTYDVPPKVGRVIDASYGEPLREGGMVTITFVRPHITPLALIQKDEIGWMAYCSSLPAVERVPLTDFGPFNHFHPHSMVRTSDGVLLAAGYVLQASDPRAWTCLFLRSEDEGRSWQYLSHIHNPYPFGFGEPGILAGPNGHVLALHRVDWRGPDKKLIPLEDRFEDARNPDDHWWYYLYQTESWDCGRTWSEPVKLPIWGHPAYLLRLQSGNVLLVYGHRRHPYSIRAVLSRDEGKTWDLKTMRMVRVFQPGQYDIGYPQTTQLEDGTILCAYYGYAGHGQRIAPCGIYVSLFDEAWLEKGESVK